MVLADYGMKVGRSRYRRLLARAYRVRRRCGCELWEIDLTRLAALDNANDRLASRERWRKAGFALVRKAARSPGGPLFRYLAP